MDPHCGEGDIMPLQQEKEHYTYADFCTWDDDERWELIDGVPYAMAPPSRFHQSICINLCGQLWQFLKGKPCEVYSSPIGVRLNADSTDDTVLQPDIVVVCDHSKLDAAGIIGAPDMVVEILSPSTARRDRLDKLLEYQKAGVREYWIVDPETRTLSAHVLENGKYTIFAYGDEGTAPVHVLEGCEIILTEIFEHVE